MKVSRFNIFVVMVVSLGGFLFGFDASVISGVTGYIKPEFGLSDLQLGWVVGAPTFSAMFAMLSAGFIADKIGRKPVLIGVAFLYAFSAIWSSLAAGYIELYIARMIGGVAFGTVLVLVPVYIAEISPSKNRGALVSIQQLNIVLGFSIAYFSNYFLQGNINADGLLTEQNVWRWMLGIEFLPAVLYFILLFFIPRSPHWLLLNDKKNEAYQIILKLHGSDHAASYFTSLEQNLSSNIQKAPLSALFKKSLRYVLFIGITLGILQQITGVNAIYFYATTIFEQSGIGTNAAFAQAVWVGIINVIFTIVAMLLIDKIGRKPLLLLGLAGITISMALTSYGFHRATYTLTADNISMFEEIESNDLPSVIGQNFTDEIEFKNALKKDLGILKFIEYQVPLLKAAININPILVLIGILGFVASFAISLGPVMWVMLSELFPTWIRAVAISVIGFINSLTSWLVQFVFPWELSNLGNAVTYLIYALFALIGLLIFIKYLPETKGKSLEELESELIV